MKGMRFSLGNTRGYRDGYIHMVTGVGWVTKALSGEQKAGTTSVADAPGTAVADVPGTVPHHTHKQGGICRFGKNSKPYKWHDMLLCAMCHVPASAGIVLAPDDCRECCHHIVQGEGMLGVSSTSR